MGNRASGESYGGSGGAATSLAPGCTGTDLTLSGALTAVGVVNSGLEVVAPTTQTLTAVTDTIQPVSGSVVLNNTSGGGLTLTSTPSIATAGVADGTILILRATLGGVTLQDESALAGSKLRLATGSNKAIGVNDELALVFDEPTGFWRQLTTLQATT